MTRIGARLACSSEGPRQERVRLSYSMVFLGVFTRSTQIYNPHNNGGLQHGMHFFSRERLSTLLSRCDISIPLC